MYLPAALILSVSAWKTLTPTTPLFSFLCLKPTAKPSVHPLTIWLPIIIMALAPLWSFTTTPSRRAWREEKERPAYLTRLEKGFDGCGERLGKQVKLSDVKGKVLVLAHVYTTCPVGCSQIVSEMKDLCDGIRRKRQGGWASLVLRRPPEVQTSRPGAPEAVCRRLTTSRRTTWWFVNGDQAKIRTYLSRVVKFYEVKEKAKDKQTSEVDKYEHDMRIALVDHEGHLRGMYDAHYPRPGVRAFAQKKIRKDLAYLLAEQKLPNDRRPACRQCHPECLRHGRPGAFRCRSSSNWNTRAHHHHEPCAGDLRRVPDLLPH